MCDAGVVDEYIQSASQVGCARNQISQLAGIVEIDSDRKGLTTRCPDKGDGFRECAWCIAGLLHTTSGDNDRGSSAGQPLRNGTADATAGASDQRNFTGKGLHHILPK